MKTLLIALVPMLFACAPVAHDATPEGDTTQGLSGSADPAPAAASTTPKFEDLESYLIDSGNDASFTSWVNLRTTLRDNFDDVCGDTFCEGDYSNLEPVRLRCSVESASGKLKSCKYVFAGSYEDINASTGSIKVTAKTFSCAIAVSGVPVAGFLSTLTAAPVNTEDRALQRKLPGSTKSIYDSLVGCL